MTTPHPDVIVVGAGVVGTLCAWHLRRHGARVLVLDAGSGGSTAASAAVLRTTCDTPELAAAGLAWYREWSADRPLGLAAFRPGGVAVVTPAEASGAAADAARRAASVLPGGGAVRVAVDDLPVLVPGLVPGGDVVWMEPLSGWADPQLLVGSVLLEFRHLGGHGERARVLAIRPDGTGWRVVTEEGDRTSGAVVVAAGAASADLLPPGPRPAVARVIARTAVLATAAPAIGPTIVDLAAGLLLRPHPAGVLGTLRAEFPPAGFGAALRAAAAARMSLVATSCGRVREAEHDVTPDGRPFIGPLAPGLHVAYGFNGAGFKTAPPLAQALARTVLSAAPSRLLREFTPLRPSTPPTPVTPLA